MDNCYQRADTPSDPAVLRATKETYGASVTLAAAYCDPNSRGDTGMVVAYGLIQRLVQDGVPVSWSIKAGKSAWADADFAVVGGGGSPVKHMSRAGSITDPYSALSTIKYSGAPFIISADDAAAAKTLINSYGSDFNDVSFHISQTSFDAPIYKTLGSMPKMAVFDLTGYFTQDKSGFLDGSIGDVEMDGLVGTWWEYVDGADVIAGNLVSGGTANYALLWIPSFEIKKTAGSYSVSSDERKILDAIEAFAAAGGSIVAQDTAAHSLEGFGTYSAGTFTSEWAQPMTSKFAHSDGGFTYGFYASAYGGNSTTELTATDDYSDPSSQWGGASWTGIGGSKFDWTARCDRGYNDGVRRMVYTNDLGGGTDDVEFASWKHYDNDSSLGRIYYLGGFNWRKNTHSGFRLQMNTIFVVANDYAPGDGEVSRSSPIVATVGGREAQYTGTYDAEFPLNPATIYSGAADNASFEFPNVTGHLRALNTAELADGDNNFSSDAFDPTSPDYNANLVQFDAADVIAGMTTKTSGSGCAITGTCRHIFTNDGTTKVSLVEDNLDNFKTTFGSFTDPEATILMERVHAGQSDGSGGYVPALGGVDRSTLALIESSPLAGTVRPTIAYFGGLDGMMHAVCADTVAPCGAVGQELWAFLPRTELSKVATNSTRVDGSPKVADVFGNFGGSSKEYRTVLTFQSGNNHPAATYALDITDPGDPKILWQHTTPGAGANLAMGVVNIEGEGLVNTTFIQTSNGSNTVSGMYLAAINSATGEEVWPSFSQNYLNNRGTSVPTTGIPGGMTLFASDGGDVADTLLVPSLWGAVWAYDARDGKNQNGTSPLFQFETDYHPIGAPVSIYRDEEDQQLRAIIVSGGFADLEAPTSTSWAPDAVMQYAISFPIETSAAPITDEEVRTNGLGLYIELGAGNRAFSQAVIVGNQIFITTDSSDVNSALFGSGAATGLLHQIDVTGGFSGATVSSSVIASGAASVDVSRGTNAVYTGGGNGVRKGVISSPFATGTGTEASASSTARRFLWLRTQ